MQVMKKAMSNIQLRDSNLVRNSTGAYDRSLISDEARMMAPPTIWLR